MKTIIENKILLEIQEKDFTIKYIKDEDLFHLLNHETDQSTRIVLSNLDTYINHATQMKDLFNKLKNFLDNGSEGNI